MLRRIHDPERGASLTEYAAVVVLVASVIAAVMGIGIPDRVNTMLDHAFGTLDDPGAVSADGSSDASNGGSDPSGGQTGDEDSSGDGWNTDDISAAAPSDGGGPGEASGAQPIPSLPTEARPLGLGDPAGFTSGLHPGGAKVEQVGAEEWVDEGREQAQGFGQEMWDIGVQAWEGTKQAALHPVETAKETAKGVKDFVQGTVDDVKSAAQDAGDDFWRTWETEGPVAAAFGYAKDWAVYMNWESPVGFGGLFVPDEAREYWSEGEYGRAAAQVAANAVTYLPGLWGAKVTRFLPDPKSPDRPGAKDEDQGGSQESKEDKDGITCASNSFLPGTPVLLADGTTAPIEDITAGDEVWAFDPRTGEEGPREVTATITGDGPKTLVDITTDDGSGSTGTVTATDEHPFWAPEPAQWVDAIDLEPGTWLRTSTGTWTQVTATDAHRADDQQVHNLTIQGLHTYYASIGDSAILSHNSPGCVTLDKSGTNKLREYWANSGQTIKKKQNVAVANVEIEGLPKRQLVSVSGKDDKTPTGTVREPAPEDRVFETVDPNNEKVVRPNDSEVKILEEISSQLDKAGTPKAHGRIELYSELPICGSCSNVITKFKKRYPNIEIIVSQE
ncbi:deaminase domain-containing protein [Nocardiopsis potens]|uniref:deaminase domain-containing protein n=1 Tax=Nocardiopsis potens TaxID=1246458 RepID=UPI00034AF59B|nr:deaminase domain-containing protein [Nocardiopsis potens]